jgi:hypothetical protein
MRSLENLYSINVTVPSNTSLLDQRRAEAQTYLIEVVEGPVDNALSGVLWLCPCAVSQNWAMSSIWTNTSLKSESVRARSWLWLRLDHSYRHIH